MSNVVIDRMRATIHEIHLQRPMWDNANTERLRVLAWRAMVHAPLMLWLRAMALRLRMERHLRRLRNATPQF